MATIPSSSLATLRPDIAGAMMAFDLQANINNFVALQIAPVIEVDEQQGNWGLLTIAQLLQTRDDKRAPGADYQSGDGGLTAATYICQEHGFEESVDDREAKMYGNYFDAELVAAQRSRHTVLQNLESGTVTAVMDTGTGGVPWTGGTSSSQTAANLWSDPINSTPIDDMTSALEQLYGQIGRTDATLSISWKRFNKLRNNAQILDRIKYNGYSDTQRQSVNEKMIADALGLENLIVAKPVKNTANEQAAAVLASLWTDSAALLFIAPKTIDLREACFARTFHWSEDGSSIGGTIESYRWERSRSNRVRARVDYQTKIVYQQAAVQLTI